MELINGIIISISKYKESDNIIKILTNNNIESVQVSKNVYIKENINKFSGGEFRIYKGGQKYYKLSAFNQTFFLKNTYDDFNKLIIIDFLNELLSYLNEYKETIDFTGLYDFLLKEIKNIDSKERNHFYECLVIYINILKILGMDPRNEEEFILLNKDVMLNENIDKNNFRKYFNLLSKILAFNLDIHLESYKNINNL